MEQPENIPPWVHVDGVTTQTAVAVDDILGNVQKNITRKIPKIQNLPEFMKIKGRDVPIALVGGGPSLKNRLDQLRFYHTILAAGSSNDYLMAHGIVPTYTAMCDPDKIMSYYLKKQHTETKYLVAYCCAPETFDALEGKQIVGWHCHSDELHEKYKELDKEYTAIGGGCTIGLRSLNIALMLGYTNIHLFGYDSCMDNDKSHAYDFANKEEEEAGIALDKLYYIKVGNKKVGEPFEGAKERVCVGYQMAQAQQFKDWYMQYYNLCTLTFHGDGLLRDIANGIDQEIEEKRKLGVA